jgi:lipoprotein Spr
MVKNIFPAVAIIFLLASCSSLKPLSFTSNKQVMNVSAEPESKPVSTNTTKQVKFIDNITVSSQATTVAPAQPKITAPAGGDKFEQKETVKTRGLNIEETAPPPVSMFGDRSAVVEMASPVQLKYAILLNTEVEQLQDKTLLESVDAQQNLVLIVPLLYRHLFSQLMVLHCRELPVSNTRLLNAFQEQN